MIDFDYVSPSGTHAKMSARDRFLQQVDKNGPIQPHCPELGNCWVWVGKMFSNGYGFFLYKDKKRLAHRASWELETGSEPYGIHVLHKCDNRACVRHTHHFLGTALDNAHDRISKGRSKYAVGEDAGNTKLTKEIVLDIRSKYAEGSTFMKELAKKYGVSQKQISTIISGKQWKHLNEF